MHIWVCKIFKDTPGRPKNKRETKIQRSKVKLKPAAVLGHLLIPTTKGFGFRCWTEEAGQRQPQRWQHVEYAGHRSESFTCINPTPRAHPGGGSAPGATHEAEQWKVYTQWTSPLGKHALQKERQENASVWALALEEGTPLGLRSEFILYVLKKIP